MHSIGINLQQHLDTGLLTFHASRPTASGLETHLALKFKIIMDTKPAVMVVDPISNLISVGNVNEVKSMLTRLVDFLKMNQITTIFTALTTAGEGLEETQVGISSLMDTWIVLRDVERVGERNREIHVLKSRGMAHSNQLREFVMTDKGIELLDVYVGPAGVLTGTARVAQEAKEKAEAVLHEQELERRKRELEGRRKELEAQIEALHAEVGTAEVELNSMLTQEKMRKSALAEEEARMSVYRGADVPSRQKEGVEGENK
jgi:circadian clock protein KaiC